MHSAITISGVTLDGERIFSIKNNLKLIQSVAQIKTGDSEYQYITVYLQGIHPNLAIASIVTRQKTDLHNMNADQHCVAPHELVCIWYDVQKVFRCSKMKECPILTVCLSKSEWCETCSRFGIFEIRCHL